MNAGRFLDHDHRALCEASGDRRFVATRVFAGRLLPSCLLSLAAQGLSERCPTAAGRVHGLGGFEDDDVWHRLATHLPAGTRLKRRFEWYACRGAGFHNDAHYAGVLFGAWCIAGPPRDIVFPRCGIRVRAGARDLAVFDPFEPHAVLDCGRSCYSPAEYEAAPPSVFLGFEIELDAMARQLFRVEPWSNGAEHGIARLASRIPINAETGALP